MGLGVGKVGGTTKSNMSSTLRVTYEDQQLISRHHISDYFVKIQVKFVLVALTI